MSEKQGDGSKAGNETPALTDTPPAAPPVAPPPPPPLPLPQPPAPTAEAKKTLEERVRAGAWWVPFAGGLSGFIALMALPVTIWGNCAQQRSADIAERQEQRAQQRDEQERAEAEQRRRDLADAGNAPQVTARLLRFAPREVRTPDGGRSLQFNVSLEVTNHGPTAELVSGASLAFGPVATGPTYYVYGGTKRFGLARSRDAPNLKRRGAESIPTSQMSDPRRSVEQVDQPRRKTAISTED